MPVFVVDAFPPGGILAGDKITFRTGVLWIGPQEVASVKIGIGRGVEYAMEVLAAGVAIIVGNGISGITLKVN